MTGAGQCTIAIFARAPIPGQCKTRLIPNLGADGAALLQEWMIHRALETARTAGTGPLQLWCSPDTSHPALWQLAERYRATLHEQHGNDLGERMHSTFLLAQGPLLLMGTDCPSITSDDLRDCAAGLSQADAVFLPAEDGGYGLVGLNVPMPELFSGMQWSTPDVMSETRARMRTKNLAWYEIRTIWDVDEPEDYARLLASGILPEPLADGQRDR
jgi:rSAM/selenodomain-associated transferase 1